MNASPNWEDLVLFFGLEASHYGSVTYSIEICEDALIEASHIPYLDLQSLEKLAPVLSQVVQQMKCTEEEAYDYLAHIRCPSASDQELYDNPELAHQLAEQSWDLQHLAGEAGKTLGYRGVILPDEYGYSYLIDMANREDELNLVSEEE